MMTICVAKDDTMKPGDIVKQELEQGLSISSAKSSERALFTPLRASGPN